VRATAAQARRAGSRATLFGGTASAPDDGSAEEAQMSRALTAYGVVLVVLLMLTREYEAAGWRDVGALEVTAALVNSLLAVSVAAGVLLAGRLGLERWARSMARWRRRRPLAADE
jgi:hypothetical protein